MKKILVVGDAILDHYVYGDINRMSPEDKEVPVLDMKEEEFRLGGCLNVAANLKSLCSKNEIRVASIVDRTSKAMLHRRKIKHGMSFEMDREYCIVKTRFVGSKVKYVPGFNPRKQLLRLDNRLTFDKRNIDNFYWNISFLDKADVDAIVISDYNKGIIDFRLVQILEQCKVPIFVDTKKPDFSMWKNIENCILKVNHKEYEKAINCSDLKTYVVTHGIMGAVLHDGGKTSIFPTTPVENAEVTGAGDVFLAGLVTDYLRTENLTMAVEFANMAAAESVRHQGTTEVKIDGI